MAEDRRVDLTYLEDLAMGDKQMMVEMIEMFLENTPGMLDDIEKLIEEEKWEKVASLAHKYKPNMDYMGLSESKQILIKIEEEAKNEQDVKALINHLKQLRTHSRQAYSELNEVLENIQ